MSLLMMKPYSILFYTTMTTGVVISLSSTNWIMIWMGLELTLYSFIPILLQSSNNQEKEAAMKYFMTQALASGLLLLSILSASSLEQMSFLILFSLMMKMGLAPFHFWLPSVMSSISWFMCWILSTIIKIAPMILLINLIQDFSIYSISCVSSLSVLVGGLGGLNQTQIRPLLAYSSISHMGWTISCSLVAPSLATFYFFAYLLMISAILMSLNFMGLFSSKFSLDLFNTPKLMQMNFILLMLSLSGLPPLFGFYPKLLVLMNLVNLNMLPMTFILIFGTLINTFFYLKLFISLFFSTPSSVSPTFIKFWHYPATPMITSLASITSIIFISLFFL